MPADPRAVGGVLSKAGGALSAAAPALALASGPLGVAAGLLGAVAAIAGDVLQGPQAPAVRAADPGPLLDAMRSRWAAKRKAAAP